MPTYDYECTQCGHTFEVFQLINEKPLNKCPQCNKKLRRLIGAGAGIIFKGSGFYCTDYKKSNASTENSPAKNPTADKTTAENKPSSNNAKSNEST